MKFKDYILGRTKPTHFIDNHKGKWRYLEGRDGYTNGHILFFQAKPPKFIQNQMDVVQLPDVPLPPNKFVLDRNENFARPDRVVPEASYFKNGTRTLVILRYGKKDVAAIDEEYWVLLHRQIKGDLKYKVNTKEPGANPVSVWSGVDLVAVVMPILDREQRKENK